LIGKQSQDPRSPLPKEKKKKEHGTTMHAWTIQISRERMSATAYIIGAARTAWQHIRQRGMHSPSDSLLVLVMVLSTDSVGKPILSPFPCCRSSRSPSPSLLSLSHFPISLPQPSRHVGTAGSFD
jgi:hypothetical protein